MGKVVIVTGANQGLGFALVKGLCDALDSDDTVYLTARDSVKGKAALAELGAVTPSLLFEHLDVTEDASVSAIAEKIRTRHAGIDVVIANAAARISKDTPSAEQVGPFVNTNNHGTYRMFAHFLPLLKKDARFIVVASSFGQLSHLPPSLHEYFDIAAKDLEGIEQTMDRYVSSVQAGTAVAEGWPEWINIPSKVGQVASAKVASRITQEERPHDGILINAVCPGLVDTAASRPWFDDMSSAQTPDEAAVDVLWLALLPTGVREPQGELIQFRKPLPWI